MHLPVVDYQSATAAADFCRSLHETGFGVLRSHPLDQYLADHPEVKPKVITRFEPWMALSFSEGSIGGDIEDVKAKAQRLAAAAA